MRTATAASRNQAGYRLWAASDGYGDAQWSACRAAYEVRLEPIGDIFNFFCARTQRKNCRSCSHSDAAWRRCLWPFVHRAEWIIRATHRSRGFAVTWSSNNDVHYEAICGHSRRLHTERAQRGSSALAILSDRSNPPKLRAKRCLPSKALKGARPKLAFLGQLPFTSD